MKKPTPSGYFLRIPFDWRRPTLRRIRQRIWNPGGPMLSPKVFGWGYTLNLAHRASKWLVAVVLVGSMLAILA